MRNRGKVFTYVLVQQSVLANSIVATCSRVYVVDHPRAAHVHGLVATYTSDAKSLCALPVPVPQLLSVVQL